MSFADQFSICFYVDHPGTSSLQQFERPGPQAE